MRTVLIVLLVLLLLGALPVWPYARSYGYGWHPAGGILLLILLVLLLFGI